MEIIMKFNLPEERQEYELYYNGPLYVTLVETFYNQFRRWDKADEPTYQEVRDKFFDLLQDIKYDF